MLEALIILVLILVNGLLSMSEMAIVASRKSRLQQRAEDGDVGAQIALEVARQPGPFLSTVQIGITLVGTLAGAFGGAAAAEPLAAWIGKIPQLTPYASAISVAVVVLAITYLSLVLGELTPKRIALNNAERIAAATAPMMQVLARATSPIVRVLSISTEAVLRLFRIKASDDLPVTEDEVRILIEQGTQFGVFEPIEETIVGQVFRLSDLNAGALITPRTDIDWLDINDSPEKIRSDIIAGGHSRYPVANGELDNVLGIVLVKDLLAAVLAGEPFNIETTLQPPLFLPESMSAFEVLERLRQTRTHIALIIDEYGGIEGLVTLEDFVESIIGAMPDVGEQSSPAIVLRADGSYLLDGMLPIHRFQDLFELDELPEATEGYYQTVGGFVMAMLGRIPSAGDQFVWQNVQLEVLDMDGRRVDKVLASHTPQAT